MDINAARTLALELMTEHNLTGWRLQFTNAKKVFGVCRYTTHTIRLSQLLVELNAASEVRNTILHEIAHALVGPSPRAHGFEWRQMAISIGCSGDRCYGPSVAQPKKLWTLHCRNCDYTSGRHRKTPKQWYCGACIKTYGRARIREFPLTQTPTSKYEEAKHGQAKWKHQNWEPLQLFA